MDSKRLTIDKQLELGWRYLYELEVIEDLPEETMLLQLERAAECIRALRARKRLTLTQREKLARIERWYGSYDLKGIRQAVNLRKGRKRR